MKRKTIQTILDNKFNEFLDSIDDVTIRDMVRDNAIITGGCIVSMLLDEKVNDYDLYFRNKETALAVARHYVTKFKNNPPETLKGKMLDIEVVEKSNGQVEIQIKNSIIESVIRELPDDLEGGQVDKPADTPPYSPIFISSTAIMLSNKVQLIIRFYGEVDDIHEDYDFVHCRNAWTSWDGELLLRPDALECILTKELIYVGSGYPLCSIMRLRKFIKRGWYISAGQILKMCMTLNRFDLADIEVLKDQLVGVDVSYFVEIISLLRDKQLEDLEKRDCDGRIDEAYLFELINKIF